MLHKGRIKWYHPLKGYGYILVPGKPDLFFHIKDRQIRDLEPSASGEPILMGIRQQIGPDLFREPNRDGGEWVYYEVNYTRIPPHQGKPKAWPWEFADEYDTVKYKSEVLAGKSPKVPMPFHIALAYLRYMHFDCLKDRAVGDCEFSWHLTRGGMEVAHGTAKGESCDVYIDETEYYLATRFEGQLAFVLRNNEGSTSTVQINDAGDPRNR